MTMIDSKPLALIGSTRSSFFPLMYIISFDDFTMALNRNGRVAPEMRRPNVAVALPGISTFSFSSVTSSSTTVSLGSMFTAVICKLYFEAAGSACFGREGYPKSSLGFPSPEGSAPPLPV